MGHKKLAFKIIKTVLLIIVWINLVSKSYIIRPLTVTGLT